MSEELLKNDGEGEDKETEAHQMKSQVKSQVRNEDDEAAEDVEGHLQVRTANDEDSDDVEAHRFKA